MSASPPPAPCTGVLNAAVRAACTKEHEPVHPRERLLDEARGLAGRIAASGPPATRGARRIATVRETGGVAAARSLSDALRYALEWSRDVDEGMAAHREGRPPRFTGR